MQNSVATDTASSTMDPRIPPRDDCVTRYLIDRWATQMPDEEFAVFQDGETWSYAALRDRVVTLAAGLASQGVDQGDHVAGREQGGDPGLLRHQLSRCRLRSPQYSLQGQGT